MFKRLHFSLVMSLLFLFKMDARAQISLLGTVDTVQVYMDALPQSGDVLVTWQVSNVGENAVQLMVTRNLIDTVSPFNHPYVFGNAGSYERFCWGNQCYLFGSSNSATQESYLVDIQPGMIDSTFTIDFYPNGVVGNTTMEYCFHEVGDWESAVCQTVTFEVDASVRIDGPEDFAARGMAIAPNPASASTTITVDASNAGVLEFRNLVGQIAKSVAVVPHTQGQRISLEDLPDGLWLVSHKVNGSVVATKRLVKH